MARIAVTRSQYVTSTDHLSSVNGDEMGMKANTDTRKENIQRLLVRLELWLAPLLIILPLSVSLFFLWDWFVRGFSAKTSVYDGELFLGLLLLAGNLVFDTPFLRSVRMLKKKL